MHSSTDKCGVDTSVYGGCFMSDNKLLLPLYDGQRLALFNSNGDLIKQSDQLSGRVYDVCMLDPSTVVVTRCIDKVIDYINIPTLTVNKTVSLGVTCYGITNQNKPKSKQKLCDPCKSTDDDVTAVSWCHDCNEALCQMCVNAHKKLKVSKDHNLKNIDELEDAPVITSVQSCENHKGKIVVAFCRDHNQSCCATCVAIHHRKCDHVTTLEEAANDILESKELLDLLERLKSTSDLNKDIVTTTMINVIEKPITVT
ncbi:hypothetical protein KUTeg_011406 [Tegillarca granosa]|uniref:B box-type domain-containing protein n=1 Tax=Tegillarca granosa TaxID=220873 RepID=A0ABQ9F3B3_TEGGR|nr:hypothetical protein KUTeg_011406 [Tegillarca granosa]